MLKDESTTEPFKIAASIRATLASLRGWIRVYILCETLAIVVIWLGVTFWCGFAVDYLPVLLGANEMPQVARSLLLLGIAGGTGYLLYRYWLARWFVPFTDRSLALLLERKYQQFHDSLVTSVEWENRRVEPSLAADMLARSHDQAMASIGEVRLSTLFNLGPLVRNGLLALLCLGSVAVAYRQNPAGMRQAAERLYLLTDERWSRYAHIEMLGVEVRRTAATPSLTPVQLIPFVNGVVKVPRGANITLKVQADAKRPVVPKHCVLQYTTPDHDIGNATLKTQGRVQEHKQLYLCDSKPLAGILTSLDISVTGYDHRVAGYKIEVLDSPEIVAATMDVNFPEYMVDEQNSVRLPRLAEQVQPAGHAFPFGTNLHFQFTSSKPLSRHIIRVLDPLAEADKAVLKELVDEIEPSANKTGFDLDLVVPQQNRTLEISLIDTDGIASERPFRVVLNATADEAPRWELSLQGIGNMITPDARVPLVGRVTDDYGVAKSWLLVQGGEQKQLFPATLNKAGELEQAIDFRELRTTGTNLEIKPGVKLSFLAQANDSYNLSEQANLGSSERFPLEVVTTEQLLANLETREISLRRRFEQILEEMNDMRDSLLRVRPAAPATNNRDPSESVEPVEKQLSPAELLSREKELRLLRVQRAVQQLRKSSQEVAGVAQAFDAIREELENNRVDTEERKTRLKTLIADPLHQLVKHEFVALEEQLNALEPLLEDAVAGPALAEKSVAQTNELIAQLDAILQKMLKLESYNEIIDLVRDLIREQQALRDDTKRQQKKELEE
jgi:hypothetical protein